MGKAKRHECHDLGDTGAPFYPTELSSQLEAGQLRVCIYTVDGE